MLDPLGGILAFAGLVIDEFSRQHKADVYLAEQKRKNAVTGISHPDPHRDPQTGKIIIENNLLYYEDLRKYGAVQTMKWVNEGKYNLTPEELQKEHERLKAQMEYLYSL